MSRSVGKPEQVPRNFASKQRNHEEVEPPKVDTSWKNLTGANFRLQQQDGFPELDKSHWAEERKILFDVFNMTLTDSCLSAVIVASIVLLVVEVDQHAWRGKPEDPHYPMPELWLVISSKVLVLFFMVEIALRFYVYRGAFLVMGFGLDLIVVMIDFTLAVLDLVLDLDRVPQMTYLRVFRIIRLLRVRRVILQFPELCYLISGIASSVRAITWGVIMVYIMIVIWAMVAVNLLHPIARAAALSNPDDCGEDCMAAFSSVWNAILTLSQTLVFSDDWGTTALPIIHQNKAAFLFFLIAFSSVALAALNLILAAIVDSGAQAREEAARARSEKQRQVVAQEELGRTRYLLSLCQQLDYDDSGSLTLQELLNGFEVNKNFCKTMEELNLEKSDIEVFFTVVDKDGSGEVDYKEFLDLVAQARRQASQQVLTFVKFALLDMRSKTKRDIDDLGKQVGELKQILLTKQPEAPAAAEIPEPKKTIIKRPSRVQSRPSQRVADTPLQASQTASQPPHQPLQKKDFEPIQNAMQVGADEAPEDMPISRKYILGVNGTPAVNSTPAVSFLQENGEVLWLPEMQATADRMSSDMKRLLHEVDKFQVCLTRAGSRASVTASVFPEANQLEGNEEDEEIAATRV